VLAGVGLDEAAIDAALRGAGAASAGS